LGNLVNQPLAFFRGKLERIAVRLRAGAAMEACQVAGLGHFPNDDVGPFCRVDRKFIGFTLKFQQRPAAIAVTQVSVRLDFLEIAKFASP
jgi:hypothetical protein